MSKLFEISAHGSRSVSSIEEIVSTRIAIPSDYTFITFAPTGYPLYDSFNSFYAYSLHYYPDNLTNDAYNALPPDRKHIREPNIIKTKLAELSSATPEILREELINMIIKYGIISMYNYKFNRLDMTSVRTINILTNYLIYDLNYFVCNKLAKPDTQYPELIEQFLNMPIITIVKKFMSYYKDGTYVKDNIIGNIISIYKKLYSEYVSAKIGKLTNDIRKNSQEYNALKQQLNRKKSPPKPDEVIELKQKIESLESKNDKLDKKLIELRSIKGFIDNKDNIMYTHMASHLDNTIIKKALNNYIENHRPIIDKTIITSESILTLKYIDLIRRFDILNLRINVYDQAHTMPNFRFSFFGNYPGQEVSFFIGGVIETSAQPNPESIMTLTKNNDLRKHKDILRQSFQFNKLNYLSITEFFDRSGIDPIVESKRKVSNISSITLIDELKKQSDFDGKCTFVIMACNVVYLNHARANPETIQLIRTASNSTLDLTGSDSSGLDSLTRSDSSDSAPVMGPSSGLASTSASTDISQPKKSGSVENISYNHIPYVPKVSDLIKDY